MVLGKPSVLRAQKPFVQFVFVSFSSILGYSVLDIGYMSPSACYRPGWQVDSGDDRTDTDSDKVDLAKLVFAGLGWGGADCGVAPAGLGQPG